MKQIFQDLSNGDTYVEDVPRPRAGPGSVLVRSHCSLISIGTERMLLDFGRGSLVDKARQQPEKVRMVLDKIATDGLVPTYEAVRAKLNQPIPMGYSNVGVVEEVGSGVNEFSVGDRVVSNGHHAGYVSVPRNLCARIPDNVEDQHAAFTVVAAIALQGIRLAAPTLGETFVVTGLGLIGLLAVQILRSNGCRVIGIDFDEAKLERARKFGAVTVSLSAGQDPVAVAEQVTAGRGVDGVIITASSKSNDIVKQAATMCRKRGRIILVGVVGLELNRADFYEKELTFQVSCSYGPGRYDPDYETRGHDYPYGFVRWTEQRNFEAILGLLSAGQLSVDEFVDRRFPIEEADKAYDFIAENRDALGVVIDYGASADIEAHGDGEGFVQLHPPAARNAAPACIGLIGAGNYAGRVLVPAFQAAGAELHTVVSASGATGTHVGRKYGFQRSATDSSAVFSEPDISAVVIATPHNTHCDLVIDALEAGKHVFVEKPLCITEEQLQRIQEAVAESPSIVMVGFNRRFAPLIQKLKSLLEPVNDRKAFVMTVNAGAIPAEHWTQQRDVGGGRIVGEGCHFIDLLRFLAGAPVARQSVAVMRSAAQQSVPADTVSIQLEFEDGSLGIVHYLANGHASFPKERLEVFAGGRIAQVDNFRRLKAWGWPGFSGMRLWRQDKGQMQCAAAFVESVRTGSPAPIDFDEILEVSRLSIAAQDACD